MLKIILNGEAMTLEQPMTLAELQTKLNFKAGEVAVAVNHNFVPRSKYDSFQIEDQQEIEIVAPMQGG